MEIKAKAIRKRTKVKAVNKFKRDGAPAPSFFILIKVDKELILPIMDINAKSEE
jgi:hypothetical protein